MTYLHQHEKQQQQQQQHHHQQQQPLSSHHHYRLHHRSDPLSASEQQPPQQVRQETTTTTISSTTTTTSSSSVPFTSDSEPTPMYNSTRPTHRSLSSSSGTANAKARLHQQDQYPGDSGHASNGKQAHHADTDAATTNGTRRPTGTSAPSSPAPLGGGRPKVHSNSSSSSSSSSGASESSEHQGMGAHHRGLSMGQGERQRAAAEAHEASGGIHSWPILFAIVPPLGALVFGKSDVWSDMLTLALIAFFLYNIIKVPWELYYAARTRRVMLSAVTSQLGQQDPVLEMRRQAAAASLRRQELFSLLLVLGSPFLGGYTLRYLKTFFSSYEDYLSALNIELFIIASAIRPLTHLVGLLKSRALHLQEQVHYPSTEVEVLKRRMASMEAELSQLRRAVATKREVLQVQDSFEPTLHQLTKQIKRHDKRELLLRSYTEERFAQVDDKLREMDTILAYRLTEEQNHHHHHHSYRAASLVFLPLNLLVAMLGYFTYFLPARLTNTIAQKHPLAMLPGAPAPQAIGDGRAIASDASPGAAVGPGGREREMPYHHHHQQQQLQQQQQQKQQQHGPSTTHTTSSTTTTAHHLHAGRVAASHLAHRTPYEPLRESTRVY